MKKALIMILACFVVVQMGYGEKEKSSDKKERGKKSEQSERGRGGQSKRGRGHKGGSILDKCVKSENFQKQLGLTEQQITKLTKASEKFQAKRKKLEEKRKECGMDQVRALMQGNMEDVDEEAIMKSVEASGKIQTEMQKLRMKEFIVFNKTLTEEQRERTREMRKKREKKMKETHERMRGKKGQGDEDGESSREEKRKRWQEKKEKRNKKSESDKDEE